jgi:hypothetical protein
MTKAIQTTVPDIFRDARQLYLVHKENATKQAKVDNLNKVWAVLEAISEEGQQDFSLAEVGRRLERMEGPKTQSLRNAQGAHFREIIAAYATAAGAASRYIGKNKSSVEHALDLINDPSIKATLSMALDEAKRVKVINDNLHAAFKTLQVGASLTAPKIEIGPAPPAIENSSKPVETTIPARLLNALRKGIDESRLAQQGLKVCPDGSIENEHGDKIFPPAFVLAIQHLLDLK